MPTTPPLPLNKILPVQVIILGITLLLYDDMVRCVHEVNTMLDHRSAQAETFLEQHPIVIHDGLQAFRDSRAAWHRNFDQLLRDTARDFRTFVHDEQYQGECRSVHPTLFFAMDVVAVFTLVLLVGFFLYQDLWTNFGANRKQVRLAANVFFAIFVCLAVLNSPLQSLLRQAVRLSTTLKECTEQLKSLQRQVIVTGLDIEQYQLLAHLWDGTKFGARDPVFGNYVDQEFYHWFRSRFWATVGTMFTLACFLLYRASVKSLMSWRTAIPSVVCVGVIFPQSSEPDRLWRLGSGTIIDAQRGLVLTNWHLFQRMGSDEEDVVQVAPYQPSPAPSPALDYAAGRSVSDESTSAESVSGNMLPMPPGLRRSTSSQDPSPEGLGLPGTPPPSMARPYAQPAIVPPQQMQQRVVHRHLTNNSVYCEPLNEIHPDMIIVLGTPHRNHPQWEYTAHFTGIESPSVEFTPFGLDLSVIQIKERIQFDELRPQDQHSGHAYTYAFDGYSTEEIEHMVDEELQEFQLGDPYQLRAGDEKLRLLGYPASGGYTLSVLTGYFTSLSFDYAARKRGAWLNVNIALPHGGSGGAAVNNRGELGTIPLFFGLSLDSLFFVSRPQPAPPLLLSIHNPTTTVGICSQVRGGLTNIRSILEAKDLIKRAQNKIDKQRRSMTQQQRSVCAAVEDCAGSSKGIHKRLSNALRRVGGAST